MKKLAVSALAVLLAVSLVACGGGPINVTTYKAYFQLAAATFIAAEQAANPQWHSQKLAADVTGLVGVWNVGVGWQSNAITELTTMESDINDIPNCSGQCAALSIVFLGAVATGLAIAQSNQPAPTIQAAVRAAGKPDRIEVRGKVYTTAAEYKADWNKVAPADAQLK